MPNPPPGFEWDERKAQWNLRVHSLSFAAADKFDFATALELEGNNHESEEERTTLLGKIDRQVCVFVFTRRAGKIRVISLRKANAKEKRLYIQARRY